MTDKVENLKHLELKRRMAEAISLGDIHLFEEVLGDGYDTDWPLEWGTKVQAPIVTTSPIHTSCPVTNAKVIVPVVYLRPFGKDTGRAVRLLFRCGSTLQDFPLRFDGMSMERQFSEDELLDTFKALTSTPGVAVPLALIASVRYKLAPEVLKRALDTNVPGTFESKVYEILGTNPDVITAAFSGGKNPWAILYPILRNDDGDAIEALFSIGFHPCPDALSIMYREAAMQGSYSCAIAMEHRGATFKLPMDKPCSGCDSLHYKQNASKKKELTLREQILWRTCIKLHSDIEPYYHAGLVNAVSGFCDNSWSTVNELVDLLDGISDVQTYDSLQACAENLVPAHAKPEANGVPYEPDALRELILDQDSVGYLDEGEDGTITVVV